LYNGAPDKRNYKAYKVRSVSDGDDYEAMYEVLSRRFARGIEARKQAEEKAASETADKQEAEAPPAEADRWALPDLFVVDGGRGQLGVALAACKDLGLRDLPIVGLAKERETLTGDKIVDRVYLPGQKNPVNLRPNTPELFMLALARDEAHRFANVHRSKIGKKRRLASQLDDVPGIGPKTRQALLRTLGSLTAIKRATDEELLQVPGLSKKQLGALREFFQSAAPPDAPPDPSESGV
jgi:excinuclease ABC subunit C